MIVSSARLRGSERKSSERWFAGDGGMGLCLGELGGLWVSVVLLSFPSLLVR